MSLLKSTIIVTIFTFLSTVLGFFRETFIAYKFGSNSVTDAYYVASIVPNLIATWVSYTLTNALIPVLKNEELKYGKLNAKKLASVTVALSFISLLLLTAVTHFYSDNIISVLAPGFSTSEKQLAGHLLIIMETSIIFTGLSGVLWGVYNAHGNFIIPALTGLIGNVCFILVFVPSSNNGITILAWAFLLSTVSSLIFQIIPAIKKGYLSVNEIPAYHPQLMEIGKLMIPIFISVAIGSVNDIFIRIFSSNLPSGELTNLNYAQKTAFAISGILGTSLSTTLYTKFVKHDIQNDKDQFIKSLERALILLFFLGVVISYLVFINRNDIIELLFFHGEFSSGDVLSTSLPFGIYSLGIVSLMTNTILTHALYAIRKNKFIVVSSSLTILVNVLLSYITVKYFSITGFAFSHITSSLIYNMIMLLGIYKFCDKRLSSSIYVIIRSNILSISLILSLIYLCHSLINKVSNYYISSNGDSLLIKNIFNISITGIFCLFISIISLAIESIIYIKVFKIELSYKNKFFLDILISVKAYSNKYLKLR